MEIKHPKFHTVFLITGLLIGGGSSFSSFGTDFTGQVESLRMYAAGTSLPVTFATVGGVLCWNGAFSNRVEHTIILANARASGDIVTMSCGNLQIMTQIKVGTE
jgi:hypothetical protein